MEDIILNIMDKFGYIGVFFLIAVENLFPPIPSEVILTFGGFMTTISNLTFTGVLIASTLGSVIGAIILYALGRFLDKNKIYFLVEKFGKILRLTREDIDKAYVWFEKNGNLTVFFCRFIPLIRSLISIPAGMSKMNFSSFVTLTTLGTFIWNFVLIYVGAKVGESWETIVSYMDIYSNFIYALIILTFCLFVFKLYKRKNKAEPIKEEI